MARRRSIVIDEDKLAQAQAILGTTGLKDTVDRALDEVIRADLRRRMAERIRTGEGIDRSERVFRQSRPRKP